MLPRASAEQQELIKGSKLRLKSHKTTFDSSSNGALTAAVMAADKISFFYLMVISETGKEIHNTLENLTCSTASSSSPPCPQKKPETCKEPE